MSEPFSHNWSTVSLQEFDYEVPTDFYSVGLKFDGSFDVDDKGQLTTEKLSIGEQEFAAMLRAKDEGVPVPLQLFYDKCKNHFYEEFTSLLSGCISNADCIKTLTEFEDSKRLMKYFSFELTSEPAFGKAQCFVDAAKKFADETKAEFRTVRLKLQSNILHARQNVLLAAVAQLKNCRDAFMEFGRAEWIRQCQAAGSQVNILDQQYTVIRESLDDDDDESEKEKEFNEISCEMDMDKSAPKYFKMSTYLYALAIHDSKVMVNDKIQSHRDKETRARTHALAIRDKQDQVDARASFARPQDTFKNRFEKIDKRLAVVEKAAAKTTQQPIQQPSKAENLPDIDDQALTRTILARVDLLHKKVNDLCVSSSMSADFDEASSSKNDFRADASDTAAFKKALKRQKKEAAKARIDQANTQTAAATATTTQAAGPSHVTAGRGKAPSTQQQQQQQQRQQQQRQERSQQQQQPQLDKNTSNASEGDGDGAEGKPTTSQSRPMQARRGGSGRGFVRGRGHARV